MSALRVEPYSAADSGGYPSVDQRQFPIVLVVNLHSSDKNGRAAECGGDVHLVSVAESAPVLLQGKDGIFARGVLLVCLVIVVLLGKSLLLELRLAVQQGKAQNRQKAGKQVFTIS